MECPKSWISWLILIIIVLAFLAAFVVLLVRPLDPIRKSRSEIRFFLVAFQSLGVLSRFMEQNSESSALSVLLKVMDLSNMNFEIFFSMDCIFENVFGQASHSR